jgi:hypothetical protein
LFFYIANPILKPEFLKRRGMKKNTLRVGLISMATILTISAVLWPGQAPNAFATINGTNSLVSYDSTNTSPTSGDQAASSADGNFVAFESFSPNVIAGDTNGAKDLFLRNLQTNTTILVDQSTSGIQSTSGVFGSPSAFAVSRTGRYVLFTSADKYLISGMTLDGYAHVYLRDTQQGTTTLIDQTSGGAVGNDNGTAASISDDGRLVVFSSRAKNLGGATDGFARIYMKDLSNNSLQALSRSATGTNANNAASGGYASCDGSIVAIGSSATNLTSTNNGLTSTYVVDLRNGFSITNLTVGANGHTYPVSISCNGRYIVLESKATNLTSDSVSGTVTHVFRYDRLTGHYSLIDQSSDGAIAVDGATSLVASPGQFVSDNGLVVFSTYDTNLVSPAASSHYELYLRTPDSNITELVAVNSSGQEQSPGPSSFQHVGSITADGRSLIYASHASNLIPGMSLSTTNILLSKVQ